ncbi:MAG: glucosaminidase domain-containing protein [Bacteroidota bacterium]
MRKTLSIVGNAKNVFNMKWNQLKSWINRYWFKVTLLAVITLMLYQKDLNLQLNLSASPQPETALIANDHSDSPTTHPSWYQTMAQFNLGANLRKLLIGQPATDSNHHLETAHQLSIANTVSNTYSNMTYGQLDKPKASAPKTQKAQKLRKQRAYVKRFAHVAQSEMRKYGVPASIKLAQGLIESNAGESALSNRNNKHFGMNCFSRNCKKGHCSNFTDDSHKDFFRIYKSPWESYRAHSKMLNSDRYRHLFKLEKTDYKAWAKGLKKAGYATDKRYAEKLINIIEELQLYKFDNI